MDNLKNKILGLGASLVGFADLKDCLPDNFREYAQGISIAIKLDDKIIDKIKDGPTQEYSKHYQKINDKLNLIASTIKKIIEEKGYKAYVVEASKIIDNTNLKGHFSHKTTATRAGLGWIGKCALLITEEYGPRIRLVTILTNAPLKPGTPITESRCSECMVCVENCPANAPKGVNWNIKLNREDIFNVFACDRITKANKEKIGDQICGICVSVCPRGKRK